MQVVGVQAVNEAANIAQSSAIAQIRRFHPHDARSSRKFPQSGRESGRIGARPRRKENEGSREESTVRLYSKDAADLVKRLGDDPRQWDAKGVRDYFLD